MTTNQYLRIPLAGMLALLVLLPASLAAQTPVNPEVAGEVPITAPVDGGDEPEWNEDPVRVEEGTRHQLKPDEAMDALRSLRVLERLNTRGQPDYTKASGIWERVGPVGGYGSPVRNGRISGIQVLPSGSYYWVYAGACQGGLWRMRSQYPNQWTDIGYNLPNPSVRAFAVDPDDFQHIFVATGDHRRYYGGGMFETTNEGLSWNPVPLPYSNTPEYFYRVLILGDEPGTGNRRMAAVCSFGPIWSDDGGATWHRGEDTGGTLLPIDPWTDLVVRPDDPSWLYAVCCDATPNGDSGVWVSQDYGETWGRFSSTVLPPSEEWYRASLAISRSNPATVVVLVTLENTLEGVYKTENVGYDWENITNNLIDGTWKFGGSQIWHAQAVAIKPDDPDHIILGAVNLAETTNGGLGWDIGAGQTGIQEGHVDFANLSFFGASGDDMMWMGNDGGIYYHRFNTGVTYSAIGNHTTGLACSEIDYMDAERRTIAIGLQDNGTLLSVDGAATWEYIEGGDGAEVEIFDAIDGDIFFNNGVYTSDPHWRTHRLYYGAGKEDTQAPDVYMPRVHFSPFTGMLYTHGSTSLHRMNATGPIPSWVELHSNWQGLPYRTRNMWSAYGREEAFWFTYWSDYNGTSNGDEDLTYVYNEGGTWTQKHWENFNSSGLPVITVTPSNEWADEAWVGIETTPGFAKIYHLREGGDIRTNITGNLNVVNEVRAIEVMPFNPDVIWAGTDLGVYQTVDGGANWTPFMEGLPIGRCSELHFVADPTHAGPHYLVLSLDGRGVWRTEIDMPPILYVDGRVATSGDGTIWGGAYRTVGEARAVAPAGSIIAIHADDYAEPQRIDGDVKLVTWQGHSRIH